MDTHSQHSEVDGIWLEMRREAESDVKQDPVLSDYYNIILSHSSLESALCNLLSIKLCTEEVKSDALASEFATALSKDGGKIVRDDLRAVRLHDSACVSYARCFLNLKGFQACQAHRLAHHFWVNGRTALASFIQSRVSEVFGVDIHPGAVFGSGIVIDHPTGVVIGETTVIGDNVVVTMLRFVTL